MAFNPEMHECFNLTFGILCSTAFNHECMNALI